nr:MAG TPA: hypothetical protein [Caudoviricetes sp.]
MADRNQETLKGERQAAGSTVCAAEGRGNGTVEERHRKEPPAVRPADE